MTHVRFREPISGFDVTIPCYQWGQTDGQEYIERMIATTPQGVVYREKLRDTYQMPYMVRLMRVVFEQTDEVIHQLRTLSWFAMKNASQVAFYPDAAFQTFWLVDWQTTVEVERVIDNHLTIELVLIEAPTAVQASLAHLSQLAIEVMIYLGEQARLSQYAIEVMLYPTTHTAQLSQLAIETMLQLTAQNAHLSQFALEVMVAAPSTNPPLSVLGVEAVTVTDAVVALVTPLTAAGVDTIAVTDAVDVQMSGVVVPSNNLVAAQAGLEVVLEVVADASAMASQAVLEVVVAIPDAVLNVSVVETVTVLEAASAVFVSGLPAEVWASQAVVEVMLQPAAQDAQASQAVVEVVLQPASQDAQASQVVIEVMVES